jgi:hypothetical protein
MLVYLLCTMVLFALLFYHCQAFFTILIHKVELDFLVSASKLEFIECQFQSKFSKVSTVFGSFMENFELRCAIGQS